MPEFKRLGLRLEIGQYRGSYYAEPVNVKTGASDLDAGVEIFGYEAHGLFVPKADEFGATPKQVAKKIRKTVKAAGFEITAS